MKTYCSLEFLDLILQTIFRRLRPARETDMRMATLTLIIATLAIPSSAGDTHPFSIDDMLAMERISDWQVCPDGRQVVFAVSILDQENNRRLSDLYLAEIDTGSVRRLTTDRASDVQPDGVPMGKACSSCPHARDRLKFGGFSLEGGEAAPVTNLPLGVDALRISPDGRFLVFSMAVIPGKISGRDKADSRRQREIQATGLVYDRLFIRHWDTWRMARAITCSPIHFLPAPPGTSCRR